ncbi:MAG: D-amino-acid transaminase [Spirochaetia bacterium]
MSRTIYVNGEYLPEEEAKISVFDRGFLFADGVYEVTAILDGKLVDKQGHLSRLRRSLSELDLPSPASDKEIEAIQRELIRRNKVTEGLVYLQVTRGSAERSFYFPDPETTPPSLVLFTQALPVINNPQAEHGIKVITVEDLRWTRRDIKTVQLLPSSMCKMAARAQGKDDAWMVQDGYVTEGTSNNAFLVKKNHIFTRRLSSDILPGITRASVLAYAAEAGYEIQEVSFSVKEAQSAEEAFMTSATAFVLPVVEIDGQPVGDGRPGPVVRRLRELYIAESLRRAE